MNLTFTLSCGNFFKYCLRCNRISGRDYSHKLYDFFLPVQSIVPIHGCIQLASNSSRAFFLKDNVNKKIIIYFVPGLILGSILSRFILQFITSPDTFITFLLLLFFLAVFRPKNLLFKTPLPLVYLSRLYYREYLPTYWCRWPFPCSIYAWSKP